MTNKRPVLSIILSLLILMLACSFSGLPFGQGAGSTSQASQDAGQQSAIQSPDNTTQAPVARGKETATDIPDETTPFSGPRPGEPPSEISYTDDFNELKTGADGYANGGDDFSENRYERPFNLDKTYRPDLDILRTSLSKDASWFYVTIQVAGKNPANGRITANYGVELDVNKDGRGEYVVWTLPAYSSQWKRINTRIYGTSTNQVGGPHPILSDAPWAGATYNKLLFEGLFDSSHNVAWVRIVPDPRLRDYMNIQIAFSPQAVGNPTQFLWGAWADDGIKDPTKFDYNDQFTNAEAGASFINDPNYPPKAIFAVDNTCHIWVGFVPTDTSIPGSCPVSTKPAPGATATPIPGFRGPT
jgi:hypothetical protein